MDFKNHIVFREDNLPYLVKYLKENEIKYDNNGGLCTLDILESNPHWENISKIVKKYNKFYTTETIFSEDELRSAEWLRVRSIWRYDYPQPEDKYCEITYNGQKCDACGGGLVQVDAFRFKKAPKWGKRYFLTTNWEDDVLFLSGEAKAQIEMANIPGISYREVKNKSGREVYPDIYQLVINSLLPEGLIPELSPIREKHVCEKCGRVKFHYHGRGQFIYHKEAFDNVPDIVQTSEFFGWGHSSKKMVFVSQKIYRLITENKMDKSLEFQPIKLI